MVYLLRIQMFGDQARELLTDEHRPGQPRHPERLDRVLRTLSISKPDRVRPVFKSGFFLCYYNEENAEIVRELKRNITFDDSTKKIFDELCVAYMLLTVVGGSGTVFDSRFKPRPYRRRSRSASPRPGPSYHKYSKNDRERHRLPPSRQPTLDNKQWERPPVMAGVTPSSSLSSLQPGSMGSIDDAVAVLANPTDTMMNALKVLQNSATMQALMKKESQNEVIVKREEMEASLDSIPITSAPEPSPPKRLKVQRDRYASSRVIQPASSSSRTSDQDWHASNGHSTSSNDASNRQSRSFPTELKGTAAKSFQRQSDEETTLGRQLQDIRRQMTALRAQEDSLIERLKKISPSAVAAQLSSAEKTKESNSIALSDLETEREKRKRAEEVWEDARKEYRAPLVVPAMLDAFEKLAQIAGDALISTSSSASSTAYAPSEASHSQASNRWGPRKPII